MVNFPSNQPGVQNAQLLTHATSDSCQGFGPGGCTQNPTNRPGGIFNSFPEGILNRLPQIRDRFPVQNSPIMSVISQLSQVVDRIQQVLSGLMQSVGIKPAITKPGVGGIMYPVGAKPGGPVTALPAAESAPQQEKPSTMDKLKGYFKTGKKVYDFVKDNGGKVWETAKDIGKSAYDIGKSVFGGISDFFTGFFA